MCRRAVPAQPAGLGCHPRIGLGPPSANAGSPAPPARTARPEDFLRPVQRSFQVAPRAPPGPFAPPPRPATPTPLRPVQRSFQVAPRAPPGPYATAPGPTPATRPGPPAASPGSPAAEASAAVQSVVQLVGRPPRTLATSR